VAASLYEEAVDAAKRDVVVRAFEQANYDHETAARLLGLHPNYLHKLIRTMDLKPVIKRAADSGIQPRRRGGTTGTLAEKQPPNAT
jgi:hypothetical protein